MNVFAILLFLATQQPVTDTIIVTASALPESVESTPAAVTVLTRSDIDQRDARDVADLLREVPGLAVSRTGTSGHATSLFTRGAASTHTLVNAAATHAAFAATRRMGKYLYSAKNISAMKMKPRTRPT